MAELMLTMLPRRLQGYLRSTSGISMVARKSGSSREYTLPTTEAADSV